MATIHLAHLMGDVGFSRIVAAKRLRPELARDEEFVAMFLDEARIASKIHHRNVVPVLDVVTSGDEVILVQDYVHGAPLSLVQQLAAAARTRLPIPVAVAIACQILAGLYAAHATADELGIPLQIIHRDVSPQNVMIGTDGTVRLLDFGVAKAAMASHVTRVGMFKGKIAYAAPEQLRGRATQQSDLYAVGVVLWELLVGQRLHPSSRGQEAQLARILRGNIPPITRALATERAWLGDQAWDQLAALAPVLERGLAIDPRERWATALDMEVSLAAAVTPAPPAAISTWLRSIASEFLDERDRLIASEEVSWRRGTGSIPRPLTTEDHATITAAEAPRALRRPYRLGAAVVVGSVLTGAALACAIALATPDLATSSATTAMPAHALAPALALQLAPSPREHPLVHERTVAREPPPPPPRVEAVGPPPGAPPVPHRRALRRVHRAGSPRAAGPCSPPYYFHGAKKLWKPGCV